MTNKNDFAFPAFDTYNSVSESGLSKLEYFAAMAMQGLLAEGYLRHHDDDCSLIAKVSANYAKALIAELNKNLSYE